MPGLESDTSRHCVLGNGRGDVSYKHQLYGEQFQYGKLL